MPHLDTQSRTWFCYGRSAGTVLPFLVPLLLLGCGSLDQIPAPVRVANNDTPRLNRALSAWETPLSEMDQRVSQLETSNRDILADLQRRVDSQERELQLLRGTVENVQYDTKGLQDWLKLLGKPSDNPAPSTQDVSDPPEEMRQALPTRTTQTTHTTQAVTPAAPPPSVGVFPSQANVKETPQKLYDSAFSLLKGGQYEASRKKFDTFLEAFPNDTLADNAQYWIGELYAAQKRYREALVAFNQVLVRWPSSSKIPASLLKIGIAFYELGDMQNAHTSLTRLVTDYPNAPAVAMARQRLQDIARKNVTPGTSGSTTGTTSNNPPEENSSRTNRINRVMGE